MFQRVSDTTPFNQFESASRAILSTLRERVGFGLWMMTRVSGSQWQVLQAEGHGFGVTEGSTLNWADTFCYRMVERNAPRIVPSIVGIDLYRDAPLADRLNIASYIGIPLMNEDGSLYGTLCAFDAESKPASIVNELPWIELLAKLLATILSQEALKAENSRALEVTQSLLQTDQLTGLVNQQGWEKNLKIEASRVNRYGGSACVFNIELTGLAPLKDAQGPDAVDSLLRKTATSLRCSIRESDVVARIDESTFGVLALGCDQAGAETLLHKFKMSLMARNIDANVELGARLSRQD